QRDVRLGNGTNAAVDHPQADLIADINLGERLLERLDRTSTIALEDEPQFLGLALLELLEQLVQSLAPGAGSLCRHPQPRRTPFGDLPRHAIVIDYQEAVSGTGHGRQAEHLYGERRGCHGDVVTMIIEQRAYPPMCGTGDDR